MSIAFAYLDPVALGGALQPTTNGWKWTLTAAFREGTTKDVVAGITAETLDSDNLVQVGAKLGAAVKAVGAANGFNVTNVLLPQSVIVAV